MRYVIKNKRIKKNSKGKIVAWIQQLGSGSDVLQSMGT